MSPSLQGRLLLLGFWLLPAAVATLGLRLVPSRLNPGLSLAEILIAQLAIWLPWGAWSMLIVAVGERVPLERGSIRRALAVHAVLSVVVVVLQLLVITAVATRFGMVEPRGLESTIVIGIRQYGDLLMVVYWAVVGTHAAVRWHGRWQDATRQAERLQQDLATARLAALQSQLNPHFLFNALNAVVSLIDRDATLAQQTLIRLSDLLRGTLTAGSEPETTLRAEVELTARYLEIEQVRFAERLAVEWDIADGLDDSAVPTFALQPLVENALSHAVARAVAGGRVRIGAQVVSGTLCLTVRDDGADLAPAPPPRRGAGIALANLRARLERMYGAAASLTLEARPDGGHDAILRLPWRRQRSSGTDRTMTAGNAPRS